MGLFCLLYLIFVLYLYKKASIQKVRSNKFIIIPGKAMLAIALFSLLVGLRYNDTTVDPDFMGYWDLAKYGLSDIRLQREYDRFELIPRLLYDILFAYKLPPSVWFIVMGAVFAFFPTIAAVRINKRNLPVIIGGLLLLYLPFAMNGIRQGAAIAIFLCAITYIEEKNWKIFFILMAIAFGFHQSSIIWASVYLFAYFNWRRRAKFYYFVIGGVVIVVFGALSFFLQNFGIVLTAMGQEGAVQAYGVDFMVTEDDGSGFGVVMRYIRWFLLLVYIPLIAKKDSDNRLYIIFAIFIIGAVMDVFSMYSILLSRVALYPKISELLLYPYLFDYIRKNEYNMKEKVPVTLMKVIMFLQVTFLTYVLYSYLDRWHFVNIL